MMIKLRIYENHENCRLKNYMKEYTGNCNNLLSYNILHPAVLIYDFHIFITSIYQLIIFFAYYSVHL